MISGEAVPKHGKEREVARMLHDKGFTVHDARHYSVSFAGEEELWKEVFGISTMEEEPKLPEEFTGSVDSVVTAKPPEFML